jgi:serine/threonine protein kinase
MSLPAPSKGLVCGRWTLSRPLGRGGNGEVWLAQDAAGAGSAIKFLTKAKPIAYARFQSEVLVMQNCGVPGVVPIIEAELPADLTTARAWYAMPVGTPLVDHLVRATFREKVEAIAAVAATMSELHDKKISHRDIKPANLLAIGGRPCVGDFGLVDYPEKADLTGAREELGPRWTMAPEVRRQATGGDPRPADVYSLAKTLWILLSGNPQGFEGQYSATSTVGVATFARDTFIAPLEDLLSAATEHDAPRRPDMRALAKGLTEWLKIDAAFPERNRLEWIDVQRRLFPISTPARATWTDIDEIVAVLNVVAARSNMNHLFFPRGGGLDLNVAHRSRREEGCIEIVTNGITGLLKPARLMFESFPADPQWNYFRMEAAELAPSGVYDDLGDYPHEELTDVGGHTYADRSCWDYDEYEGEELPESSRSLTRYFHGAFVIFQKTSIYNRTPGTYDARHNKMTADQFREHIADVVKLIEERKEK